MTGGRLLSRQRYRRLSSGLCALIANDLIEYKSTRTQRQYALRFLRAERVLLHLEAVDFSEEEIQQATWRVRKWWRSSSRRDELNAALATHLDHFALGERMKWLARPRRDAEIEDAVPWPNGPVPVDEAYGPHPRALILPPKTVEEVHLGASPTIEDYLEHARHGQKLREELEPTIRAADLSFEAKDGKPIAIAFSSDWHLGSLGCAYERFLADMVYFGEQAAWLKLVTVGDLIENCISFKSAKAVLDQQLAPVQQLDLLEKLATRLIRSGSLIAACWGNHDVSRDEQLTGQSAVAKLFRRSGIPWFNGTGLIRLRVGEQAYTIYLTHRPRGKSMYNKTHGQGRLYREDYPADVVVAAHLHQPAFTMEYAYPLAEALGAGIGGQRVLIACGTYLTGANYALRAYGTSGRIETPTVLFWPNRKKILCVPTYKDALPHRLHEAVEDE